MKYPKIANQIIQLRDDDLAFRDQLIHNKKLSNGYDEEMELMHINHAKSLNDIIDKIGYPTVENVGKHANEAAWLIIQHAISLPSFMRKCLELMKQITQKNLSLKRQFAYLSDRIAMYEGKPQLYGTQFDWDSKNQMSPLPYDNLEKVNIRRQILELPSLEEQTEIMRKRTIIENESPPENFHARQEVFIAWKRKVGWI